MGTCLRPPAAPRCRRPDPAPGTAQHSPCLLRSQKRPAEQLWEAHPGCGEGEPGGAGASSGEGIAGGSREERSPHGHSPRPRAGLRASKGFTLKNNAAIQLSWLLAGLGFGAEAFVSSQKCAFALLVSMARAQTPAREPGSRAEASGKSRGEDRTCGEVWGTVALGTAPVLQGRQLRCYSLVLSPQKNPHVALPPAGPSPSPTRSWEQFQERLGGQLGATGRGWDPHNSIWSFQLISG